MIVLIRIWRNCKPRLAHRILRSFYSQRTHDRSTLACLLPSENAQPSPMSPGAPGCPRRSSPMSSTTSRLDVCHRNPRPRPGGDRRAWLLPDNAARTLRSRKTHDDRRDHSRYHQSLLSRLRSGHPEQSPTRGYDLVASNTDGTREGERARSRPPAAGGPMA